jgi:hypothetical protein
MLDFAIGLAVLILFVVILMLARARNGVARIRAAWAAHSLSLLLVCLLMVAGGFMTKAFIE